MLRQFYTQMKSRKPLIIFLFFLSLFVSPDLINAQTFSPISVSGFNQDVIAEGGPSSLATTSIQIDGGSSNRVIYTSAFRTFAGIGGGGIPDNGTIINGTSTYQMAPYTGNNALLLQRTQTGDLTLGTPAKYSRIRVLALSTEGVSRVNVKLFFTDGTSTDALTNYSLNDWFNSSVNLVLSGFGRCTRAAAPPYTADGYTTNPRMYYIDVTLNCTDKQKTLQRVNFTNVTTAGSNAPYPNAVFFGISGVAFSQSITTNSITPADCSGTNGGASIAITGSASPFTVAWNTNPVQTGTTVSGLPAGNYTATVTDAAGCATPYPVTIPFQSNLALTVHSDTTICRGASFAANTISNGTNFSWTPGDGVSNTGIANPTLSPTTTTTYIVNAVSGSCVENRSFTVTVVPSASVNAGPDVTVIAGDAVQLNATASAGTYQWTPSAGLSSATVLNPTATPQQTTTYSLTVTSAQGCTATDNMTVTVIPYCIKPMTAFTPNGDGINDRWIITNGACLKNAWVKVFNRYGSVVYESGDYKNDWDGSYKGKPVPDGTYYFAINYNLLNGKSEFLKGNVTILR
jgi:gliding motility-associated-like protein